MKMKNITLALAGVMAAAAFAPEASALPLFARQTGMACSACHFQHFPMLNSFGRSFKASGYTLMGAEGKVEGDDLSIPATLNMAVLTTAGYVKTNATVSSNAQVGSGLQNTGSGTVFVPGTNGEFSLFVGGKVSDHAGALAELSSVGSTALASAKLPIFYDVGGAKVGIVPFTTNSAGASYGFELLNTGANSVHTMLFVAGDANGSIAQTVSAQQYLGTNGWATGAALVANNDMGFVNLTKYHMVGPADLRGTAAGTSPAGGGQTGASLGSTYLRVAGTFDLAGWDSAVGIQSWSGRSYNSGDTANSVAAGVYNTKAGAIDGQMQGEIAGMPVGFYASYASAPASSGAQNAGANIYNTSTTDTRSAFNISTEWGVIPEKATLGAAIRRGKSGQTVGTAKNASDNSILIDGSYKLAQNMVLSLVYVAQSGDYWNATNTNTTGSKQTTISLATMF